MIDLVIGIAIGAAFSPFWMKLWDNYIAPTARRIMGSFDKK